VDTSPRTVANLGPGYSPATIITAYDGDYDLYKIPDHADNELEKAGKSIAKVHLEKGCRLGFKLDD
jgi:hypothetical protein